VTRRELSVDDRAATERLDVFLAAKLQVSRSRAHKFIQAGAVQVNGEPTRPSYEVTAGDAVAVDLPEDTHAAMPAPELPVVYEDDDIVVVDKPAGLTVHPGSGTRGEATLADFARAHTTDPDPERPGIIHRLDRDTSGLLVIAKTSAAKTAMQRQFALHTVRKTYTLLAAGRIEPAEAVIRLPLGRNPARPLQRSVVPGGREAVTRYRTLANYPGFTLVEASPETGRTHQIRVHLAAIGHPVAGDITYGSPKRPLGLARQFLHATALEFDAPSGQHISLTSPLPPDLAQVLHRLDAQV
jgi:23S rRNA pseudouridine1911/1915/1917 synthase